MVIQRITALNKKGRVLLEGIFAFGFIFLLIPKLNVNGVKLAILLFSAILLLLLSRKKKASVFIQITAV